jgi:hypothetical protein
LVWRGTPDAQDHSCDVNAAVSLSVELNQFLIGNEWVDERFRVERHTVAGIYRRESCYTSDNISSSDIYLLTVIQYV